MKRAYWVFVTGGLTAISILIITSCATTETGRRQLNFVPQEQETQLGLTAFEQMKTNLPVSRDTKANALVAKVGARIAEQAKSRMPDAKWEFVVFESPEANAFCLPGGKIGVYTGLLPITQNEPGLAAVIGHEVAHASQHHGAERMSIATSVQGVQKAAGAAVDEKYSQMTMAAVGGIAKIGAELPYSRKHESEADEVGVLYMARAGYDPEEALRFWERFAASHGEESKGAVAKVSSLLRTHPVDSKRIEDLKTLMPQAKAEFQKAPKAP